MLFAVVTKQDMFAVGFRCDEGRAFPAAHDGGEGFPGIVGSQIHSAVLVLEQKLAAIAVVGVDDADVRVAEVRQREEEFFFDIFEGAAFDFEPVVSSGIAEGVEFLIANEFWREKFIDEGDVIVKGADLEDFFAAEAEAHVPITFCIEVAAFFPFAAKPSLVPSFFDVSEKLHAELVRIQSARGGGHDARVVVGVIDDFGGVEDFFGEEFGMPIGSPSLVHDLGLSLRNEVISFVAQDFEDVAFPAFERGVIEEKFEDVALGFFGDASFGAFLGELLLARLDVFFGVDERIHVFFGAQTRNLDGRFGIVVTDLSWRCFSTEWKPWVDEVFEGQTFVDEFFDTVDAMPLDVPSDASSMVGHFVDPASVGVIRCDTTNRVDDVTSLVEVGGAKTEIIFEEVHVCVDVSHDQFLVGERIAFEQVGVGWAIVDDHLVNFREAIFVALGELLVFHAEPPMGITARETAVGGDFIHLIIRQNFEDNGEEVEAVLACGFFDAILRFSEITWQCGIEGEFAHGGPSFALSEKVLDAADDGIFVANFAGHDAFVLRKVLAQILDELARSVGTFDLTIGKHVRPRQEAIA